MNEEQKFKDSVTRMGKSIFADEEHSNSDIDEAEIAHSDAEAELSAELSESHAFENNLPIRK